MEASLGRPTIESDHIQIFSTEASHCELHWETISKRQSHRKTALSLLCGRLYSRNSHGVEQLTEFIWREDLTDIPALGKLQLKFMTLLKNLFEFQFNSFLHSWQHLPLVLWYVTDSGDGEGGQVVQSFNVAPKLFSLCSLWGKQGWDTLDLQELYMPVI